MQVPEEVGGRRIGHKRWAWCRRKGGGVGGRRREQRFISGEAERRRDNESRGEPIRVESGEGRNRENSEKKKPEEPNKQNTTALISLSGEGY